MVKPMDGGLPNESVSQNGEVANDLDPARMEKILRAMKAPRAVKRITLLKPTQARLCMFTCPS